MGALRQLCLRDQLGNPIPNVSRPCLGDTSVVVDEAVKPKYRTRGTARNWGTRARGIREVRDTDRYTSKGPGRPKEHPNREGSCRIGVGAVADKVPRTPDQQSIIEGHLRGGSTRITAIVSIILAFRVKEGSRRVSLQGSNPLDDPRDHNKTAKDSPKNHHNYLSHGDRTSKSQTSHRISKSTESRAEALLLPPRQFLDDLFAPVVAPLDDLGRRRHATGAGHHRAHRTSTSRPRRKQLSGTSIRDRQPFSCSRARLAPLLNLGPSG